jgi:hypothetical protein
MQINWAAVSDEYIVSGFMGRPAEQHTRILTKRAEAVMLYEEWKTNPAWSSVTITHVTRQKGTSNG